LIDCSFVNFLMSDEVVVVPEQLLL
jgi:agmatine/peptidylarginine deiminase